MNNNSKLKGARYLSITITCCALIMIASGVYMNFSKNDKTIIKKNYSVAIIEQKISQAKVKDLKLKDIILEINNTISLNIKDYLDNADEFDEATLKLLKLDTSSVNINQAGTYTYTITYKKKKYNGTFIIKEKELPKVDLTLKNLSLEKGAALSTNISSYIVEELTDEVKNNIIINLKDVNTTQPGEYQYSVTYDNKLYTAKIWIYEKQPTIITPNTEEEEKETEEQPTPTEKAEEE